MQRLHCTLETDQTADQGIVTGVGVAGFARADGGVQGQFRIFGTSRYSRNIQADAAQSRGAHGHKQRLNG